MPVYTDQTGNQIVLNKPPTRIISLVPSQTELLYSLGLDETVVGITKFCVHPDAWFRKKTRVGGTKQINKQVIDDLQPDLIIANKEENVKEQVEDLASHYPVWTSDVNNLEDACEMIRQIALITDTKNEGKAIIDLIESEFSTSTKSSKPIRAAYLIWQKPFMTIGGDTFIHDMMLRAGFQNIFSNLQRYPEISIEEISQNNCELLLLSSEPFPFKQKHLEEFRSTLPNVQAILVDGEMFSWYGSRLLQAPAYFAALMRRINS